MKKLIGIVNYGLSGNIYNISKAIEKAGGKPLIINTAKDFTLIEKIVLPGVGSFNNAMKELEKIEFISLLRNSDKHILGICLGMQILSKLGFERGKTKGLGLIDAEVKLIHCDGKIPHMGFNNIYVVKESQLLNGIEDECFYFMHSYEVINFTDIVALTEYSGHKFPSCIQKENIYGVQFHPEKSREAGIELFRNFINL